MAVDIVIKTERDAWDWLETISAEDFAFEEPVDISFDGWPVIDLHYKGSDFNSSIPTRVMPPLLGAQKEIYRLYCQLTYGEDNLRKLSPADRERLELVFNVAVKRVVRVSHGNRENLQPSLLLTNAVS